jgi:hypothetical protein
MAGFCNNFQDLRRLSELLSESKAAIGKPEQAPKRITVRSFTVSEGGS